MTIGTSVKTMDTPEALDCIGRGQLLRDCSACKRQVNRAADAYVIISPTWKRCNDLICRECFYTILGSAQVVLESTLRGTDQYLQERFGTSARNIHLVDE
jgi:hypothetical protein